MKLKKHLYYTFMIISSLLVAFIPFPNGGENVESQVIDIQASQFQFEPGMIRVSAGDQITINLSAMDVTHGLYIDGYEHELRADPGQTASFTFTADQGGSFRFRCSISCGALHPFMIGKIQVGPNLTLYRGVGFSVIAVLALFFRSKF